MKDRFKVITSCADYRCKVNRPSIDAVLGWNKTFINLRLIPEGKTNKGKNFLDSDYVEQETFALKDIKRIVAGLQSLLKQAEGTRDVFLHSR